MNLPDGGYGNSDEEWGIVGGGGPGREGTMGIEEVAPGGGGVVADWSVSGK